MPDDIPDLAEFIRTRASRRTASVTVPLAQGLANEILVLDRRGLTEQADALREQMRASEVTFRFQALTKSQRDEIREAMDGRDDDDELNLRAIVAMCVEPAGVTLQTLSELRDAIGVHVFDQTIDAASNEAAGGQWSVPFSSAASPTPGTQP